MGRRGLTAAIAILLISGTIAVYSRCLQNSFVNYDDETYILKNPDVRGGLSAAGIWWAVSSTARAANWHPLTWISLQLDWTLYGSKDGPLLGTESWGFHLTNILLHAAVAAVLFGVLWNMTGARWRSALVAALFAVHPLHVESVAWVAERKDVLSGLFAALTIWCYDRYTRVRNAGHYAVVAACLGLGLLAKPMLVTLPCLLLLLDFWPLRRIGWRVNDRRTSATNLGEPPRPMCSAGNALMEKLPLLGMALICCILTIYAQDRGKALRSLNQIPLDARLANAVYAYVAYLCKMAWPVNLAVFYPHAAKILSPTQTAAAGLLLALMTGLSIWRRKAWPYLLVGWFWYLGMLVPVIGLVQVGLQALADRYAYLPLIGIFIALVWLAAELTERIHATPMVGVILPAFIVTTCAALSWLQISYWHDSLALWQHALQVDQSDLAHYNLGQALAVRGETESVELRNKGHLQEAEQIRRARFSQAAEEFSEALRINPKHKEAMYNLGVLHAKLGNPAQAVRDYDAVLRLDPESAEAYFNMGLSFTLQGKLEDAVNAYLAALRLQERRSQSAQSLATRNNLAGALVALGHLDEAVRQYEAILQTPADSPAEKQAADVAAHDNLGRTLARLGKLHEAEYHYKLAVRTQPQFATGFADLGTAYLLEGKPLEAAACLEKAVQLRPWTAEYHALLAHAFRELGLAQKARPEYQQAQRLDAAWLETTNKAAWTQATSPNAATRCGAMALLQAQLLCEATESMQPRFLDTLAAAFAENGKFDSAVQVIGKAIEQLRPADQALRELLQARMALYRAGKPFRDTGGVAKH